MFRNTWLPYALSIGISEEKFWTLNPYKIKPYVKAYKLMQKQKDEEMWRMGIYVNSAVSVAVEHNLAGRKAQSKYIEKPLLADVLENDENIANSKRKEQAELFFLKLNVMKANFENSQKS